jgi:hypothetical protein
LPAARNAASFARRSAMIWFSSTGAAERGELAAPLGDDLVLVLRRGRHRCSLVHRRPCVVGS